MISLIRENSIIMKKMYKQPVVEDVTLTAENVILMVSSSGDTIKGTKNEPLRGVDVRAPQRPVLL